MSVAIRCGQSVDGNTGVPDCTMPWAVVVGGHCGSREAAQCSMPLMLLHGGCGEITLNDIQFMCQHCNTEFNHLEYIETNCAWTLKRKYRLEGSSKSETEVIHSLARENIPLRFNGGQDVISFKVSFKDFTRTLVASQQDDISSMVPWNNPITPEKVPLPFSSPVLGTVDKNPHMARAHERGEPQSPTISTRSSEGSDGAVPEPSVFKGSCVETSFRMREDKRYSTSQGKRALDDIEGSCVEEDFPMYEDRVYSRRQGSVQQERGTHDIVQDEQLSTLYLFDCSSMKMQR